VADRFKACSVPGCNGNARHSAGGRNGMCPAHHYKARRYGDPCADGAEGLGLRQMYAALKSSSDDCILWEFGTSCGYGMVFYEGRRRRVHRLVCELAHGEAPTDTHHAAHNCGNSMCVNPRHLRWATPEENEADKVAHGTHVAGVRHPRAKLTEADVLEIRSLEGTMTRKEIGALFGVAKSTVWDIHARKNWPTL
jgi:hypothetical protein